MTPTMISWLQAAPAALFLFVYAALFALVEIEIEGPHGWAERLPTWYRLTPWYARLFARVMRGKPLTGYHLAMIPLALMSFHVGFAFGQVWTPSLQVRLVAMFLYWSIVWDFLWFLWNPAFGWRRFRPGQVWWLGRRWWLGFPFEYASALGASLVVATVPWLLWRDATVLRDHALAMVWLALFVLFLAVPFTTPYQRWYRHMRRAGTDERRLVIDPGP